MHVQDFRSASHHARGRSPRITQPAQKREAQKPRQPDLSTYIGMPDDGLVSPEEFHQMRSNSHKELAHMLGGCARRILAFATPEQRRKIEAWLRTHRNRKGHIDTLNDHLMAVLLDYTGRKMTNKLSPLAAHNLVMETESLSPMLAPA